MGVLYVLVVAVVVAVVVLKCLLWFWLIALVSQRIAVAISNLFCVVLSPIKVPHIKLNQNRMKNAEVKKICYISALVDQFNRTKNQSFQTDAMFFFAHY